MLNGLLIWHHLPQQSERGVDLSRSHFKFAGDMFLQEKDDSSGLDASPDFLSVCG